MSDALVTVTDGSCTASIVDEAVVVEVVDGQAVATPFGAELLAPLLARADTAAAAAELSALRADADAAALEAILPTVRPTFDFDLRTTLPIGAVFARGAADSYIGLAGLWLAAAANVPAWPLVWNGTGYVTVGGIRLLPAETNLIVDNVATSAFVTNASSSGLTMTLSAVNEAGADMLEVHLQGTTPAGDSYAYLGLAQGDLTVAEPDSVSLLGYVRMVAGSGNDLTWDLRVEGFGGIDTASLSESETGVVTRFPVRHRNYSDDATIGAYFRWHFYASHTYDLRFRIAGLTAVRNVPGVGSVIFNSSGAEKTRPAETLRLPIAAGRWDILVETIEIGAYWVTGVLIGSGGWSLTPLAPGARHVTRVRAWPAAPLLLPGYRTTIADAFTWSSALDAATGVTVNGVGGVSSWAGGGGLSASNDGSLTAGGDDTMPTLSSDIGIPAIAWKPGDHIILDGFTAGDTFTFGVAGRSFANTVQTILGCENALGTDDYNDSLQVEINRALRAPSMFVDHAVVTLAQPVPYGFDLPFVLLVTKNGAQSRFDVAFLVDGEIKLFANIAQTLARDIEILATAAPTIGRRYAGNQEFGPGFLYGLRLGPASTPAQSLRALTEWAIDLQLRTDGAGVPTLRVTRAVAGRQSTTGFQIAWDANASATVRWQIATAAGAGSIVQTTAGLVSTATDADRYGGTWNSGKHSITGLSPDTRYFYRPIDMGGAVLGAWQSVMTFPTSGKLRIGFFSCTKFGTQYSAALEAMAAKALAENWHLVVHEGDIIYLNQSDNDIQVTRRFLLRYFAQNQSAAKLLACCGFLWILDDHDRGPNNNNLDMVLPTLPDGTVPTMPVLIGLGNQAYDETAPHYDLVDARTLAQQFDVGPFRFILPDQFAQRTITGGTVLGTGTVPAGSWDQKGWMLAAPAQAVTDGKQALVVFSSSPRNWKNNVPTEYAAVAGAFHSSTLPEICFGGDSHITCVDDGTNMAWRFCECGPAHHSASGQTAPASHLVGGGSVTKVNDPKQFALVEFDLATVGFKLRLYGSPYTGTTPTLTAEVLSTELGWAA